LGVPHKIEENKIVITKEHAIVLKTCLAGKIDEENGLTLLARDTKDWEPFQSLEKRNSSLKTMLESIDPKTQFAYFFVYDTSEDGATAGSGFEAFRKAREYLKGHYVKTGWQPVNSEAPANICDSNFNSRCTSLPSYLGGGNVNQ